MSAPGAVPAIYDEAAVRRHVALIHILAKGVPGEVVVVGAGENPAELNHRGKLGKMIPPQVRRYAVGDVEGTVMAVMAQQDRPHANVYMPYTVVRLGLKAGSRGGFDDINAVLALTVDFDADKGEAPVEPKVAPSVVVESSPGNRQLVFHLDRPLTKEEAVPLARALQRATKSDSGTGDVSHVWRVPGGWNWPNAAKVARGRALDPVPVRVLSEVPGRRVSVDELRAWLAPWLAEIEKEDAAERKARQESRARPRPENESPIALDALPPGIRELIEEGTEKGATPADRSGAFHKVVLCLHAKGHSSEAMLELLEQHPGGIAQKFEGRLATGIAYSFRKGDAKAEQHFDADAAVEAERAETATVAEEVGHLAGLNARYCVVRDAGRTRVLHFEDERQKGHRRQVAAFLSFEDFRNFYMNRFVQVGREKVPLGRWWLEHPDRRQYVGLIFEPGAERELDGRLNLWRGWGIEPEPGDWSLMRAHIREVLARGDEAADRYIVFWLAWAVQNPARRAEAALVFKGTRGTGKGTLGNAMCRIFGQHATHISSADHLAGRFNGHLRDACFLFADEAYWPGDKGAEGALKRLVTEPDLFIEAKGKDGVPVANRLRVMMASNEGWIVPAGEHERRYAVFEVGEQHRQSRRWFEPLYAQMEAGGHAAMLHDLLRLDLGDFHPRQVLRTAALVEQQSRGLSPEDQWWGELLETGILWGADPKRPDAAISNGRRDDLDRLKRRGLYDQAREVSPRLKGYSDHLLGNVLSGKGCSNARKVMRARGWHFPPLAEARRAWEGSYPGWRWRDPELAEWQADGGE